MHEPEKDRILLGAICIIAAAAMFSLAGASIKFAATTLPTEAIVFWRSLISILILAPWAIVKRNIWFNTRNIKLIAARGISVISAAYCYYYAVSKIPLADAVLLTFSSPLFVPLLGLLLFGFAMNRTILASVLIGFIGIALVVKPTSGIIDHASVIALAGGIFGAIGVVILWKIPNGENPGRIVFLFGVIGALLSFGPFIYVTPAHMLIPTLNEAKSLIALGVFSTAAHLFIALGCLIAPADKVITFDYMAIVFAAALGWIIWSEKPDALFALGSVLVIGAGIYAMQSGPHKKT